MSKETKWWHPEDAAETTIHTAAEELQRLSPSQGYLARQLARLFDLDRDQDDRIAELSATVSALVEMLTATGTLDGERLRERLREAVEEARGRSPERRGRRSSQTVLGLPVENERRAVATVMADEPSDALDTVTVVDPSAVRDEEALEQLSVERMRLEAERERILAERRELEEARDAATRAAASQQESERVAREQTRSEEQRLAEAKAELERVEAQRRWAEDQQAVVMETARQAEAARRAEAEAQAEAARQAQVEAQARAAEAEAQARAAEAEAQARAAEALAKSTPSSGNGVATAAVGTVVSDVVELSEAPASAEPPDVAASDTTSDTTRDTTSDVAEAEVAPAESSSVEAELDAWVADGSDEASAAEPAAEPSEDKTPHKDSRELDLADSSLHESRESFFGDDYAPDPYGDSIYGDMEQRSSGPGRKIALITIGLMLAIGGPLLYFGVYKNPYVGDGPAHLQVDRNKPKGSGGDTKGTAKSKTKVAAATPGTAAGQGSAAAAKTSETETPGAKTGDTSGKAPAPATKVAAKPAGSTGAAGAAGATEASAGARDPRYVALVTKAQALFAKRRRGQAFRLLRQALKIDKNGWEALERLAWRAYEAGAARRGKALAKRALAQNPDAPYAILVEAVAAHERGRKAKAKAGYKRFLAACDKCRERRDIQAALKSL